MTTSFDQDGQVRAALRRIFGDHGREGLDRIDLVSLAMPGDAPAGRLARAAAECGVAGLLAARIAAGDTVDGAIRAVVLHLCGRSGLELIGCDWVVYEYALAIGLVSEYPTVSGGLPAPVESRRREPAEVSVEDAVAATGARRVVVPPDPGSAMKAMKSWDGSPAGGDSAGGLGAAPAAASPAGYPGSSVSSTGAAAGASSPAQEAVKREMRRGVLAVNAADRMHQGRKERVEVGIARTGESAPEMVASLTAAPRLSAEVNTADYMQLQLVGDGFAITALSPPQQLVVPTARWDFDVVPLAGGTQQLSVIGTCWFTIDGQERAMAVPAFVRMVDVEVDNAYRVKRALAGNWQWIIGTILGLGGSIAAWIALFG